MSQVFGALRRFPLAYHGLRTCSLLSFRPKLHPTLTTSLCPAPHLRVPITSLSPQHPVTMATSLYPMPHLPTTTSPPLMKRRMALPRPVDHPKESDETPENQDTLTTAVLAAAHAYNSHIDPVHKPCWLRLIKMLESLLVISKYTNDLYLLANPTTRWRSQPVYKDVISQLSGMRAGGRLRFVMFLASLLRVGRYPFISFRASFGYISEAGSPHTVGSAHCPECCSTA